jgi:hypothetical protein
MRFDNQTNTLSWTVYHQVGKTTPAGPPATNAALKVWNGLGVSGPVVHDLTSAASPLRGTYQFTRQDYLDALYQGRIYLGISTSDVVDYVRGNLTWNGNNGPGGSAINYEYAAELDNSQITGLPTPSSGQGGIAILYTQGGQVYVNVLHNIAGCNQITLRRARVGEANLTHYMAEVCNGAICDQAGSAGTPDRSLWNFADTNRFPGRNEPTTLTSYLDRNQIYIVAHTTGNPDGEARGQINVPFRQTTTGSLNGDASGLQSSSLVLALSLLLSAMLWF